MADFDAMSPAALKAAMTGGTAAWGQHGSAQDHVRYIEPTENKRRRCLCGCRGARTHRGMANGICLTSGCELSMRRWVRDPYADLRRKRATMAASTPTPATPPDAQKTKETRR